MNVGISIWSTDPLVWSEVSDGCKPLLLFLPEGFCVISNISPSLELILSSYHVRSGLINSRLHNWLFRNTFFWKMLRHWGASKMWSQATRFLSPWAKSQGRTYFKRDKNMQKTWIDHVSTMKIPTSWLPFEHLQVGGERRWVNLWANDSWIIRHCWVKLKGKPTAQDEDENQGPLEGITHHHKGGCRSYHLSKLWRKWNKTLQDSNKGFLLSKKKKKPSMGFGLK